MEYGMAENSGDRGTGSTDDHARDVLEISEDIFCGKQFRDSASLDLFESHRGFLSVARSIGFRV